MKALLAALALATGLAAPVQAAPAPCGAVAAALDAAAPSGPAFAASYGPGPGEAAVPLPLRNTAFAYDNALAVIALTACGDRERARRIGDAFLGALEADRTFADGRVRNAYRAGPATARPVLLPGWWDGKAKRWSEDRYQVGSATGNVAWVGLALMTLHAATGEARYRAGAARLLGWITANAAAQTGLTAGFTGGRDGYDPEQTPLPWASTEHNLDVVALGTWLGTWLGPEGEGAARSARAFVDAAFDEGAGCFRMGTGPDGRMRDTTEIALDTQLWPLLAVADPPAPWRRALACAEERLAVPGGFDFNDDRDGLWVEGTAQAALAYRAVGDHARSAALLRTALGERAPSGLLYATREAKLTTGLTIGPGSTTPDFLYFRRPHLGATAWAVLAQAGWNPFDGKLLR
ncbi:hypothetical protein [Methylobacterium sp. 17Sr1-1]|uniref:hypothetical protein n=1 Tax=Methylobacterium sp. 17Sr1-1 TaxID=2202826 RepID=UPI001FE1730C|nr:hypothetical protein [Methylobacterium sp. 17Sr1-1]